MATAPSASSLSRRAGVAEGLRLEASTHRWFRQGIAEGHRTQTRYL